MSRDDQSADITDEDEQEDHVAVDAVEQQEFVADDGQELPDHEDSGWEDGREM